MSAEIIDFPIDREESGFPPIPRKRVFYLGPHHYAAGPGFSWSTEYWVKRVERGKKWEIYCTHPQESGSQRLFFRLCDPEEVREYFESVEFEISDEEWWEIGWRPAEGAEVIEWEYYYREANPEKFCSMCGEIFVRGPLDIEKCECAMTCAICLELLPEDPFETHECE
tara:strand:- start:1199 stop:1702 length:504 start_codon:yes stop_codon:yes gene_type:complete